MIYIYKGKIGDGKTYHVVRNEIVGAVKMGRRVYHNIDGLGEGLHGRRLSEMTGRRVDEMDLVKMENKDEWRKLLVLAPDDKEGATLKVKRDSLIVVDEAQMIYDARDFKNTSKEFLTLLEYHRHFGLDLVFITQNVKRLESAIRALCNECYEVKNLKFLSVFLGSQYVMHTRQTPDSPITSSKRGQLEPQYFALYRSAVQHSRFARAGGGAFSTASIILVLLLGGYGVYSVYTKNMFMGKGAKKKNADVNHTAGLVATAPSVPLGLKDAIADRPSVKLEDYKADLLVAQAVIGGDPKKNCVLREVKSSMRFKWKGQPEEYTEKIRLVPFCY